MAVGISNEQYDKIIKPVKSERHIDTWFIPLHYSQCICCRCQAGISDAWLVYFGGQASPYPISSEAKDRVYKHVATTERYPKDMICDYCYYDF